jgi:hypothetical protein
MKPDVLFWFYKDFEICKERLQRLRKLNTGVRVFALYGGSLLEANAAENALHGLVDDFYVYPEEKNSRWKWKHGDQMIAKWHEERGQYLKWETIFIMQWDMIILSPFENIFSTLKPQEILLSGFTPVSRISSWWPWVDPKNSDFLSFKELLHTRFNYEGELFACLFIVVCLPRIFLDKYVACGHPEIGFIEYKIPTMAHMFNISVCSNHDFEPWWMSNPATKNVPKRLRTLNAVGQEIPFSVIFHELADNNGKRLFHPVFRSLPGWVDNQHIVMFLRYTFILKGYALSIQGMEKLRRNLKPLARRLSKNTDEF